jgi:hypothetical protein
VARRASTLHRAQAAQLAGQGAETQARAPREQYHRIVYSGTLLAAEKAEEAFVLKGKKQCPGVAASLEGAGENLLMS